jgi:biotin operon repressor
LEPLLFAERVEVIRKGLEEAKTKNEYEISIAPEAEQCISMFSEGYPHFIQQFAYSAFEEDKDNVISEEDFFKGAFKENGAFQQLGLKYFHGLYFDQIGSDEYREVLRAMSKHLDNWVSKDQIRKEAKIKQTTLNNAISSLKKRKIIIPKPGKKGEYRLPNKSFAVWIKAFTQGREAVCTSQNSAESKMQSHS